MPPLNGTRADVMKKAWAAEWGHSFDLQAEFPSVDDYVAFKKAEAEGLIKVFGDRR